MEEFSRLRNKCKSEADVTGVFAQRFSGKMNKICKTGTIESFLPPIKSAFAGARTMTLGSRSNKQNRSYSLPKITQKAISEMDRLDRYKLYRCKQNSLKMSIGKETRQRLKI